MYSHENRVQFAILRTVCRNPWAEVVYEPIATKKKIV